ncbi:Pyridoxamine 5'-phosphate oxidase [Micromonospora halophytica]|uniref:Pyridoxamine 5'-phosphate oxidase n=1 Tax=Micromonospora halophytica TaxID=47864 RepID=A0A1C5IZS1_9ACTN|nr:Pyridoxamine 5'-phosphate oxidase [Micromonospora halophytica]
MTVEITSPEELRDLLGAPTPRAVAKERVVLHERDRQWLATSPFCLVATAGADGSCDVSAKGDPAGFVRVLDDTTIAIPERPGNRRARRAFLRSELWRPESGRRRCRRGPGWSRRWRRCRRASPTWNATTTARRTSARCTGGSRGGARHRWCPLFDTLRT